LLTLLPLLLTLLTLLPLPLPPLLLSRPLHLKRRTRSLWRSPCRDRSPACPA